MVGEIYMLPVLPRPGDTYDFQFSLSPFVLLASSQSSERPASDYDGSVANGFSYVCLPVSSHLFLCVSLIIRRYNLSLRYSEQFSAVKLAAWRSGSVVGRTNLELLHTSSPVSTGMGDRLLAGTAPCQCTKPTRCVFVVDHIVSKSLNSTGPYSA